MKSINFITLFSLSCFINLLAVNTDTIFWETTGVVSDSGYLIMTGGKKPVHIMEEMAELMGGKDKLLLVCPTAHNKPLKDVHIENYTNNGFTKVQRLHTDIRDTANSSNFCSIIDSASAVWFRGGTPNIYSQVYRGTKTDSALLRLLERGGVIAGNSAGAMIQGQWNGLYMAYAEENEFLNYPMLNFLPGVIIRAHVNSGDDMSRRDFIPLVEQYPRLLALGLPESTGAIIHKNIIRVSGDSIFIYDSTQIKPSVNSDNYLVLHHGETFNVETRQQVNYRPVLNKSVSDTVINANSAFTISLPDSLFYDVNTKDSLVINANLSDGTALPEWITFNDSLKEFSGTTPTSGSVTIKVSASDITGAKIAANFTLEVYNPLKINNNEAEILVMLSNNKLILSPSYPLKNCMVRVVNMQGKACFVKQTELLNTSVFTLPDLNTGIYVISIVNNHYQSHQKVFLNSK